MKRSFKQWAARAAHLLFSAAAISVPLTAQEAPPSADTFAFNATPKTNYGPSPLLAVTNGSTAFLQFNLSGMPANATVSKAMLRLYVDAVTKSGSFDVYEVNAPWTEGSLNFVNAPTPGLSATGSKPVPINSSNCDQFVLVDITTLVQDWLKGTVANNGVALKLASAAGGFSFDSKESPLTSHEPELEISLATAGPAGPQGAVGATGPAGPQGPQGVPGNMNPGSPYYLQNGTATQTGANFNIDGNGTAAGTLAGGTVNSTNGYQVGGKTVFSASTALENIAIGDGAGNASATGMDNQSLGFNSGKSLTTGAYNVLIGSGAGMDTTTGSNDVAIGILSAPFQTSGSNNTFVGPYTGFSTTTGSNNTFLGNGAGTLNTTGNSNTFVGDSVGYVNTTGSGNLYLGAGTGGANATGSNNVYLSNAGVVESNAIRIGNNQTATYIAGIFGTSVASGQPVVVDSTGHLGSATGVTVTGTVAGNAVNSATGYAISGTTIFNANPATENIAIGDGAGNAATTGANNQIIGNHAGASLTTGNADVFLGANAGLATTTGNGDVAIGFLAGQNQTTGAYNTFVGAQTGYNDNTGNRNTFLGFNTGFSDTTGELNTFLGSAAGHDTTTGASNTFIGTDAGVNNITGSNDIFINNRGADESSTIRIGDPANQNSAYIAGIFGGSVNSGQPVYVDSTGHLGTSGNTSGYQIGGKTIFNANPAIENIAIGDGAGNATATGGSNQIIGDHSGSKLTTGNADVFLGSLAGASVTTGNGDVYIGYLSGTNDTTGAYNTFVGGETGLANATGSNNTYLGFRAGIHDIGGSGNTFLGQDAGNLNTNGSNDIYVSNQGVDGESNAIRIGDPASQNAAYIAGIYGVTSASGVPVFINSNGQLGTQTSSRRYKEEIREMGDATAALMKLRPVTFYYKHEYDNGPRTMQYGLIAEEVAKVFPELVAYNPDGTPYTVRYQFLSSMLLNEVQKQYRRGQDQAEVIQAQQQQISNLEERFTRIEKILSSGGGDAEGRSTESQVKLEGSVKLDAIGYRH